MNWLRLTTRAVPRPSSLCTSCARRFYASDPLNPRPSASAVPGSRPEGKEPIVQDEIATPPLEGDPAAPEPDSKSDPQAAASQSTSQRPTGSPLRSLTGQREELKRNSEIHNSMFAGTASAPYLGQASNRSITTEREALESHHLHILATKHNTHITLTRPNRNPIISVSAGNLGFRKSNRGEFDAAYQLAAFVFSSIQERGILSNINHLEVVFRGFGVGRDAVTKALLGVEGQNLRHKVNRVTDHTRLKFGGTRSRKPRRLG